MNKQNETISYLTHEQALDLVERIAARTVDFHHEMSEPEKEAMAQLLADIGVSTSDLIDVSNLADNYDINAEIVTPIDYKHHNMEQVKKDSLFQWKEEDGTHYCLNW